MGIPSPFAPRPSPIKPPLQMDTRIIKAIVALGAIAFNTYLFVLGRWGWGITLLFVTALLVLVVFRSTRLIMVFYHMRTQKMDKAKQWLMRINPDHLWAKQKGYFYFLLGSADIQTNSLSQSEKNFRMALQHGLRQPGGHFGQSSQKTRSHYPAQRSQEIRFERIFEE